MLRRTVWIACLWALSWAPPVLADELSLAEAVRLSLVRNERSKIASLTVTSAEASVRRARAGFLPSVSVGASETFRPYVEDTNFRTTNANATLTVSQPLLAVTAFPTHAGAKHAYEAARHGEVDQRQQLAESAAVSFFAVIAQQRVLTASRNRLARADASLADTRARAAAELVSTNDVTRSALERASALQSVAVSESALARARLDLGFILDVEVTSDLRSPGVSLAPVSLDELELTRFAIAQRPDLKAAIESVSAASALADEPGLRFVPTISASGQVRVADQSIAGPRYVDQTIALNLNWAIFDAGVRGADADARNATLSTVDLQRRTLVRQIRTGVRQSIAGLIAARTALAAAQEGLLAAELNVTETDVLYKQGLAKAIELVDANSSRFEADVSLAAAQLEVRRSELDLRSAMGLFPVDGVK
jgi:outer membrane protein TolC